MEHLLKRIDEIEDGHHGSDAAAAPSAHPAVTPDPPRLSADVDELDVLAAMRRIAAWGAGEHGARSALDALRLFIAIGEADDPSGGREMLARTDAAQFAGGALAAFDAATMLAQLTDELFGEASERDAHIIEQRILEPGRTATLEELGDIHGVTRERIRQIEARWRQRIADAVALPARAPLRRALERLATDLGVAAPQGVVARHLARLTPADAPDRSADRRAGELALVLAGPYRQSADGWFERGVDDAWRKGVETGLQELAASPEPTLEAAGDVLVGAGLHPDLVEGWIARSPRFRTQHGLLIDTSGSWADRAVRVLRVVDRPMTFDELDEMLDDPAGRGIRARIWSDDRFRRTSKDHVGLREWGGEEYTGIVDEIRQEIARHGGAATSAVICDSLVQRFGVSRSSVSAYLGTAFFRRDPDGAFRVAEGVERELGSRPIELARGCYLHDGWVYGARVTEPMLRGSGFGVTAAFTSHLGLRRIGDSRDFQADWGQVRFARQATTSSSGSIRMGLREAAAKIGDYVFLLPLGANRLALRVIDLEAVEAAVGTRRALLLMGKRTEPDDDGAREEIATMLAMPAATPWPDIRDRLRRRGEQAIADLLP